jgi:uncharacterized protein (TIGR03083 family)
MSSTPDLVERYVVPWKEAVDDVIALLRGLDADDWARPTDLPGWDVRAVAAHLAHVEAVLAGLEDDREDVAVSTPGPARTVVAAYTEAGVRAREEHAPQELVDELEKMGLRVRVGLHTGECELIGEDVGGMAVHICARVMALAGAGEVLVSGTTYGTAVGAGLTFSDRGTHHLKGVPGPWPVFALRRTLTAAAPSRPHRRRGGRAAP